MSDAGITIERLRADVAAIIDVPPAALGDADDLMDAGLDSMRAMNLAFAWEEAGIPLDFTDLAERPTIAGLWALVEPRLADAGG